MAVDIEGLYRKYGPMVLRRCRYILGNEENAVDAMQDVFVKVLKKQKFLNTNSPSSLLYTIATNLCINRLRYIGRRPETRSATILQHIAGAEDVERTILEGAFLKRIFKDEKASTRTIAVLHYVDKLTLKETADFVGLSVSGVRKRLRDLRRRGLTLLEEWE